MSRLRPWDDTFPDIGWDYAMAQPLLSRTIRQRVKSGLTFQRQRASDARLFEFVRKNATTKEKQQVENFHRDLRDGYFIVKIPSYYFDGTNEQPGYFAVEFDKDPQMAYVGPNSWFIAVRLLESVGKLAAKNILPGVDGLFNVWPGVNQPDGWTVNTDNTQDWLHTISPGSYGSVLKILTDGLVNPGIINTSPDLGQTAILSNRKYTASLYLMRTAGFNTNFAIDLFGTGLNTTGLVILNANISTVALTRHFGDIADGGVATAIPSNATVRLFPEGSPPAANNLFVDELYIVEGDVPADEIFADPKLGYPSYYIDEEDGEVISGTWSENFSFRSHNERHRNNPNTTAGQQFRFHYFGRGFYLVAFKLPDRGRGKVLLDGVEIGTFDQYNAAGENWDRILGKLDVALGQHEVIVETTNTKNPASSANTIEVDAIEVIP